MPYVKCKYRVEDMDFDDLGDPYGVTIIEDRYLAGEYKHVEWDGKVLTVGKKKIYSAASEEAYGCTEIDFLEIDGTVYLKDELP